MPRPSSRLLTSGALAAGVLVVPLALAGPAAADLTLPSPLPTVSAPVDVSTTVAEPLQSAVASLTGGSTSSPTALPTAVPPLPSLPAVAPVTGGGDTGQSQPPAKRSTSSSGTPTSGNPVGDDVLPAAIEDQLCALLEQIMTPMPKEISGLPASVIDQLPAQLTDEVPDDVLRVVTLRCGAAAVAAEQPAAGTPAADRRPTLSRHHRTTRTHGRAAMASTSSSALPHTGLVAGIPLAGLGLVLSGVAVRRKVRPAAPRD